MLVLIQMFFFSKLIQKITFVKTSEMLALRYSVLGIIQTLKGNGCLLFVDAAQKLNKTQ